MERGNSGVVSSRASITLQVGQTRDNCVHEIIFINTRIVEKSYLIEVRETLAGLLVRLFNSFGNFQKRLPGYSREVLAC